MFLQILTFLLKFRTLLSVCLPCWFLGTPLKWFILSCSSVRIALTLFLLQPQHPASWYCSAWVDPASMEHPSICLLEQCCLALRFFTNFLCDSIFEKRGYLSICKLFPFFLPQLRNQAQPSFLILFPSVRNPDSASFGQFSSSVSSEFSQMSLSLICWFFICKSIPWVCLGTHMALFTIVAEYLDLF